MVNLGRIIKHMRLSAKLSQLELAKKLSIARTTVSSYEVNNSEPDFNTLLKICNICGYKLTILKDNEKIELEEMSKEKDF